MLVFLTLQYMEMKLFLLVFACCIPGLPSAAPEKIVTDKREEACKLGVDVAVVVDASESVGKANLDNLKAFLAKFVDRFHVSKDGTHVALLTFSQHVDVLFPLTKFQTNEAVKENIRKMSDHLHWHTRTDKALKTLEHEIFTEEGGDRPDRANYAFVFTDGKPTGEDSLDYEPVGTVVRRLETTKGVTVIAIGYGKKVNDETLYDMAGTLGHYFHIGSIDELHEEIDSIISAACEAVHGGYSNWTDWGECNATCGGGQRNRSRTCTNPPPKGRGKNCTDLGPAEEKQACNEEECAPPCKTALDLGVIVDISKSVGTSNLPKLKQALLIIVDKFNESSDGTHMGLVTFAKDAELHFSFADTEYQNPAAAKEKIGEINKLSLQTRTDKALIMANDELFTEAGGDRPDKPNVLLVFTDGKPTPKPGYKDFDETVPPLLAKGVKINAVGIGSGVDQDVLRQIAGEGGNVFMVDDFDKLLQALEKIKKVSCGM